MSQSAEQIARQFANANINKKIFNDLVQNVKVQGAEGDGTNNDTDSVQDAIDLSGLVAIPEGTYRVTAIDNKYGREFLGPGKIIKNGVLYNSYAYRDKVFGVNFLSSFHKKIMNGTATKIVFSGDSTTAGDSVVSRSNFIDQVVLTAAQKDGFSNVTVENNGVGGKHTGEWETLYVNNDLADAPDVLVLRWGINDPYYGRTLDQFVTSLRNGLGTVRAARPLNSLAIILMSPNSTSDTPNKRDELWYETMIPAVKEAARDFQCCFIDTYGFHQDSRNASDWMDDPFGDGRHIHPTDVANLWFGGYIYDVLFPTIIRLKYGGGTTTKSTAPITLYVDPTNGNDSNDGLTTSTKLKTRQAAINKLPSVLDHLCIISVVPGIDDEVVSIAGFTGKGSLQLNGGLDLADSDIYKTGRVKLDNVKIPVTVRGFNFTTTTGHGVEVVNSQWAAIVTCKSTSLTTEFDGANAVASLIFLTGCNFSNKARAIASGYLSNIYSENNSGTGNLKGLSAFNSSFIGKSGTQPDGTLKEEKYNGGDIYDKTLSDPQSVTLLNGWVNFGFDTSIPGYYRDSNNTVYLTGVIKDGITTTATVLFTLPPEFRPTTARFFGQDCDTGHASVQVHYNGEVRIQSGSNVYLSLDGIYFRAGM